MKKIIICNIMMKNRLDHFRYKVSGNSTIEFDGEVIFPINGVLARTLNKNDEVKVVLLKKEDINGNSDRNVGEFMRELNLINKDIGSVIDYKVLSTPHNESREIQEKLLKDIVDEFTDNAAVYADITYGTKSLPIIVFSVLNFVEKFFKADIKNIVYGKVDFDKNGIPINPELFDMTPLFYLNSIANTMECKDSDQAKKLLDSILTA
ncbi:hypothetical protein LQZ19_04490 [Treponema primitia]|uniref:hypothetical protein n=1 Tax=Treponema primitia TaxID=88058 RepID=UPI00397F47D7